jgi:hypothetical protein
VALDDSEFPDLRGAKRKGVGKARSVKMFGFFDQHDHDPRTEKHL